MSQTASRRHFLKTAPLALAGFWASCRTRSAGRNPPPGHLGLQLWSVRDDMKKDPAGTVAALARMGYREVEGFGYDAGKIFGMPLQDFVRLLKDHGIAMPSIHQGMGLKDYHAETKTLSDDFKKRLDELAAVGLRYVVCPSLSADDRKQPAQIAALFEAAGAYVRPAGLRFAYHNHDVEFHEKVADGRLFYEWLLQAVDPALMTMQMDLYWVVYAGSDPLDWFRRFPGRFELCHVKDLAKTERRETVEIGDGSIDFPGIFKQGRQAGFQYYIVELEHYVTTPLQGVQRARENFLKINNLLPPTANTK